MTTIAQWEWQKRRRERLVEAARGGQRAIPSMFVPLTGNADLLGEEEARKKLSSLLNKAREGTDFTLYEVLIEALECYLTTTKE